MNEFAEINKLKNILVDIIVPLLDDLRENKNEINVIADSFVIDVDDYYIIKCIKLALHEIFDSNTDIRGRADVYDDLGIYSSIIDELYGGPVKGVTVLLFLDKDKDRLNHPDINRFYVQFPEFYIGGFDEEDKYDNKFFGAIFDSILAVKEKWVPFSYRKLKAISRDRFRFVTAAVKKVAEEGLKCKVIKQKISDNAENVYFFIFETRYEEIDRIREVLERRIVARLV